MKHIVFVIGYYKNGGVAMRATNLANELGKRGYRVTILVTKDIGNDVYFKTSDNVEIVSLDEFIESHVQNEAILRELSACEKKLRYYKRLRYFTKGIEVVDKKLAMYVRKLRIGEKLRQYVVLNKEAVYIPFGLSYFEATVYAVEGFPAKVIYAERNAPQMELPKEKEKADLLLNLLNRADGAVFQTEEEKCFYEEYISVNTAVIRNPIKENLPTPHNGERKKIITNFCRIAEQKNLKLLIDAFVRVQQDYPEYQLHIYGNAVTEVEEQLRDALIQYVGSIGQTESIRILPPAADVHSKIRDYAMFVSSSDFEGLSNSMIEAMAIGMPCICTDCLGGGTREMIQHGVNGLLTPMKDVNALHDAMIYFIEHPEVAQACGENAASINKEMSVDKIVDKWVNVIERA